MTCNSNPFFTPTLPNFCAEYFEDIEKNPNHYCEDQKRLMALVKKVFEEEEVYVDEEQYEKYIGLGRHIGFNRGYPWERFVIGCFLCTYWKETNEPRWDEGIFFMGRGAGKDGLIEWMSLCLISPYNHIQKYDVDICAYNEDQSKRPIRDIVEAFTDNKPYFKKYFYWTKEQVQGLKNLGYIKGHTNNAKGKDGLRSGAVFLNEIHTYENFDNINVFTTGLGKKKNPRIAYFSTNGDVMDGPLDELIKQSEGILYENKEDKGFFPFICRLDKKEDVYDEERWHKANPSLQFKPELKKEIQKEFDKWESNPMLLPAFMTKRMNLRQTAQNNPVAPWEQIKATEQEIPYDKLQGCDCVVGIDYAKVNDWVSVNLHFKDDNNRRYDINHCFVCLQSDTLHRIKAPFKEWAELGLVTLVDEPEIPPKMVADYIDSQKKLYNICKIALDSYRFAVLKDALASIGYFYDDKIIKLIRPSDIMQAIPMIDHCFANSYFYWGNAPHLRWATNNTYKVPSKKSKLSKTGEIDTGNWLYGKIEPKSRKTDAFMALVACMCCEDEIVVRVSADKPKRQRIGIQSY